MQDEPDETLSLVLQRVDMNDERWIVKTCFTPPSRPNEVFLKHVLTEKLVKTVLLKFLLKLVFSKLTLKSHYPNNHLVCLLRVKLQNKITVPHNA